jgi:uncharacterized protein (DUF2267 family)
MSTTGLKSLDRGLESTNIWLNEMMKLLNWDDRERAYRGFRAVLHALRDRLTVDETAHLAAQLPMFLKGLYYDGWHPAHKPVKERSKEQFLEHIHKQFEFELTADPEEITRAVFTVIANHVTAGEVDDVKHVLPAEIRELWP